MPKPSYMMGVVATLMNDTARTFYTDQIVLPYFNLALDTLQELYELNGLPITNETSFAITIPAGIGKIGFGTVPALPSDLIEIQQLWESSSGLNQWLPMDKKDFIPHYLEDTTTISQFLIWSWKHQTIEVIPANQPNDLKIDYVASIFNTPILLQNVNVNMPFTNIGTFLEFMTAAYTSMFSAENEVRAQELTGLAGQALSRALGIPIKGMQSIPIRRRPFRFALKNRGSISSF